MREEPQLYTCRPATKQFITWLKKFSCELKADWINRLSKLGPSYVGTTRRELARTVGKAFNANLDYLACCNLSKTNTFIDYITKKRLREGFSLSDVQKAFELFRLVVMDRLVQENNIILIAESVERLNSCLSYTIHSFSDYYQHMHELSISEHARNLEHAIQTRTAELRDSEKRYKTLVEEINDGYFIIQDKRILFANKAFCSMHKVHPNMVVGRPFTDFVVPESIPNLLRSYLDIMGGGSGFGPVLYQVAGEPVETGVREVRARRSDLGSGPVIIGICRDISDRVLMEKKVREHERMAYLGRLSASLSHELRNPLSAIKMNLQLLERKLDLDGYDRRRLQISVNEVSRLEDILRQLLDTARPLSVNKSLDDLAAVTRKCVDLLEPKIFEKALTLGQSYSKKIPQLELDSSKIQQVVINLLLNAIEAAPIGGHVSIWTKLVRVKNSRSVELGVMDNGPGIPPDLRRSLFAQFSTSKSHGSGLGLSNVKRIVEAHSGTVHVRSKEGQGATFIIRLPLTDAAMETH